MKKHPYEYLDVGQLRWVARGIGGYAAELAGHLHHGFPQPGDDAGRCAAAAFRAHGAEAAASVLIAFARGYNAAAPSYGAEGVTKERLLATCGMVLDVELDEGQIERVKSALARELKVEDIDPVKR